MDSATPNSLELSGHVRSQSFSIYLLKPSFNASNALEDDHVLTTGAQADLLPPKAVLYIHDGKPRPPWWRDYFGIRQSLNQIGKGALVFMPVEKRWLALCFGHIAHFLKEESYEYDFGLRVTLNSVDPGKLKSTDTFQPGRSRRQRTQVPVVSDLTYFDIDRDSTILRGLTGKVRTEHSSFFKHATGASNVRLSSALSPSDLPKLGEKLLDLYASKDFETTFPDIQSVTPIRDPVQIRELDELLLKAVRARDEALSLAMPEIVNFAESTYAAFRGAGQSLLYEDVFIGRYYEYLEQNSLDLKSLSLDDLRRHSLLLVDDNATPRSPRHSILKCLIFDVTTSTGTFHYTERNWYKVDPSYVAMLQSFLDPLCQTSSLPAYIHISEGEYNKAAATHSRICLDLTSISPPGTTAIEPCDLYEAVGGVATLHHIKVSTLSTQLSHLFNQGTNAVELLKDDTDSLNLLKKLLEKRASSIELPKLVQPLSDARYHVAFGIVTHKDPNKRSLNLPLFSRISLRRCMRSLRVMSVRGSYSFIQDKSQKKPGFRKVQKKKKAQP